MFGCWETGEDGKENPESLFFQRSQTGREREREGKPSGGWAWVSRMEAAKERFGKKVWVLNAVVVGVLAVYI